MHIQEGTDTTLTTCTKMTEEVDRRHGVNGNSSNKAVSEDVSGHNPSLAATGGRLKFFKDGKFILELVRGGERAGWVSVPRKTFWPPAAAPATPPALPPPCASLSVSDDNSSVQSSPWQRDHCWKQPTPRRNVSKELAMYYCRPSTLHNAAIAAPARLKRRRPYDTTHLDVAALLNGAAPRTLSNGLCDKKRNGEVALPDAKPCGGDDVVDAAPSETKTKTNSTDDRRTDYEREKYFHMKLKKPYQYHKLRVYKKTRPQMRSKVLNRTIDKLREKISSLPVLVNAKLANCRQEHMMVSPRKRILREMERVSLEDQATKRRAKTVPALSTASYPPSPGPSHAAKPEPARSNGTGPRKEAPSKNVCSYSIHSLLNRPDESPSRRSPQSYGPLLSESPGAATSEPSGSPDGYRYRYGALGGPPTPPELRQRAASGYARAWPPAYRGGDVYAYPYGYVPLYRAPPLWLQYAPHAPHAAHAAHAPHAAHVAHATHAPGPWAPLPHPHPLLTDHIPKDEHTSDLPLNLSKH
ncbi:protein hairless [Battus philenor]|uniref:protein hairless n=1 Tax=Battus philenor TaxID=42288 RepID=UPI0035D06C39